MITAYSCQKFVQLLRWWELSSVVVATFQDTFTCKIKQCAVVLFVAYQTNQVNFTFYFHLLSKVYKQLVEKGDIVAQPEKRPPTVPMDYNWAQVRHFLCSVQLFLSLAFPHQMTDYAKFMILLSLPSVACTLACRSTWHSLKEKIYIFYVFGTSLLS